MSRHSYDEFEDKEESDDEAGGDDDAEEPVTTKDLSINSPDVQITVENRV